ncbi:MAG: hypothetical protein M1334_04325 [Patescibacteria group bacterium]|nr:hypothetical protein [Patescibacteria group bacterium]
MDKGELLQLIEKLKNGTASKAISTAILRELNISVDELNRLFEDLLLTIRDEKRMKNR